jgi:hypothetical protein
MEAPTATLPIQLEDIHIFCVPRRNTTRVIRLSNIDFKGKSHAETGAPVWRQIMATWPQKE